MKHYCALMPGIWLFRLNILENCINNPKLFFTKTFFFIKKIQYILITNRCEEDIKIFMTKFLNYITPLAKEWLQSPLIGMGL